MERRWVRRDMAVVRLGASEGRDVVVRSGMCVYPRGRIFQPVAPYVDASVLIVSRRSYVPIQCLFQDPAPEKC